MLNEFLNPVKVIIVLTMLFAVFKLKWSNQVHSIVILFVVIDFLTEFINSLLISVYKLPYKQVALLNIILQHCLWLYLMGIIIHKEKTIRYFILGFLAFALVNFLFIQGIDKFNYYTFVLGALFYIGLFFFESFYQLKKENFSFIFSNNYLLLTSPILFLFGMSLMFAFVSKDVTQTKVFLNMKLYNLVNDYVSIVSYSIICLFIYKEIKIKNGN